LLHVLFVLKIDGVFEKKKSQLNRVEKGCFLYIKYKFLKKIINYIFFEKKI